MTDRAKMEGTPLVLLVDDEEWTARSLESILKPEGYGVLRAYTGAQALALASKVRPDLLLIDHRLPDIMGIDLCARLRELHTIRPSTPILIFSSGTLKRQEEMDALAAGAWGVLTPPFNPKDLLGRLEPLVAAKRDADQLLESSFVDPLTGFYNVQGLMRRIRELSGDTQRSGRPLAWVVFGPAEREEVDSAGAAPGTDLGDWVGPREVTRLLSELLTAATRSSDAIGRVGDADFLILAPGTDETGANRLAERLMETLDARAATNEALSRLPLLARFHSAEKPGADLPEDVLRAASSALQQELGGGTGSTPRIGPFQSN